MSMLKLSKAEMILVSLLIITAYLLFSIVISNPLRWENVFYVLLWVSIYFLSAILVGAEVEGERVIQ